MQRDSKTLLNWWRLAGEGPIARWSLEAAPARPAARVSLRGRGGGRRGVLAVAVSTCASPQPPGEPGLPALLGQMTGARGRGGGATRTCSRAHRGPPACHGCSGALAPSPVPRVGTRLCACCVGRR